MYRSATLAIVVSSTSMKVGTTTAAATNQGLIAGRLAAVGSMATLLMGGLLRREEREDGSQGSPDSSVLVQGQVGPLGTGGFDGEASPEIDTTGPCGSARSGCNIWPACGPSGRSL